jgi:PKD repeat protein
MKKISVAVILFVLCVASLCGATTHNVSTKAELTTALSNAVAGDIINIAAVEITNATSLRPSRSGTAGNPIIIQGQGMNSTILSSTNTGRELDPPVFEIQNCSYITIRNLWMRYGANTIRIAYDYSASNIIVDNCRITLANGYSDNNKALVYINSKASNITISNNDIGPNQSGVGIAMFSCGNVNILNNHIHNLVCYYSGGGTSTASGILSKHTPTGIITIRNNWFHDMTRGMSLNMKNSFVINNLVYNVTEACIYAAQGSGGCSTQGFLNNQVTHNTFKTTGANKGALYLAGYQDGCTQSGSQNNTIRDNIFLTTTSASGSEKQPMCIEPYMTRGLVGNTSDYNLYYQPGSTRISLDSTSRTLAAWQSLYPALDAHSLSTQPVFVDSVSPESPSDFALASGSAGRNAASDGTDMGIDASRVGPADDGGCDLPSAYYTPSAVTGDTNDVITFTNGSVDATSYEWHFGDGGTSTSASPTHTYTSPGNFAPYLIATNECGSHTYYGSTIAITPPQTPTADFHGTVVSGVTPLTVTFVNDSTNGPFTAVAWDIDNDGDTDYTSSDCTHTFTTGVYSVKLTVTNAEGSNTVTKSNYITVTSGGVAPDTPKVQGIQFAEQVFGEEVVFHTEFDGTESLDDLFYDYDGGSGTAFAVATGGAGGTAKAAKASWVQGQVDAGACAYHFGDCASGPQSHVGQKFTEIYTRFYMKMSPDWSGQPVKLARITSFADSSWSQPMAAHLWGNTGYFTIDQDPVSGIDTDNTLKTSGWNDTSDFTWLGLRRGTDPVYDGSENDRWICVETRVKLNTAGSSDGIFQTWIDGVLDNTQTTLNWVRSYTDKGINVVRLENYWNQGSGKAQSRYIDNFVISTAPIGFATSPINPYIYKTPMVSASGATQRSITAQVSTSAGTAGKVWEGTIETTADSFQVNSTNGEFSGARAGQTALAGDTVYYVRVLVTDNGDLSSPWSAWIPFKTENAATGVVPTASFTANKVETLTGSLITFSDSSEGVPLTWLWDFGDGTTSAVQNPIHSYSTPGWKTVSLTVTNANGQNVLTRSSYINIMSERPKIFSKGVVFSVNGIRMQ